MTQHSREHLIGIVEQRFTAELDAQREMIPENLRGAMAGQMAAATHDSAASAVDALIAAGVFGEVKATPAETLAMQQELAELVQANRAGRQFLIESTGRDIDARAIRVDGILETVLDAVLPPETVERVQMELAVAAEQRDRITTALQIAAAEAAEQSPALVAPNHELVLPG